jgi:hypothetical protein
LGFISNVATIVFSTIASACPLDYVAVREADHNLFNGSELPSSDAAGNACGVWDNHNIVTHQR